MTVPSVTFGRGAWTKTGKHNGSRYYEYIQDLVLDGVNPTTNANYEAVWYGVKSIQTRVNEYITVFGGYPAGLLPVNGRFGPGSRTAVKYVQKILGFSQAAQDGIVGPGTARKMYKDLVGWYAGINHVPAAHVWGMTVLESAIDPGAVGFTTPSDRGLCQINLVAHPAISIVQAFDHNFALNYTADRYEQARAQFSGKGETLQTQCAIAQHNSPLAAKQWYQNGVPPNPDISKYVNLVTTAAATY